MHRIVCLLLGLCWGACLPAQSFLDSYQAVVRLAQEKKIAEALAICEKILPEAEAFLGDQSLNLANFYNSLAGFYTQTQNDSAAFAFYTKVAHIRAQQLGLLHPERLKTLNKMANALFRQGRYAQAEALYRQLIVLVGPHQASLGRFYYNAWSNLGFLYFQQKQWEKADSAYQKASPGYQEMAQADTAEWLLHTERQARLYQEQSQTEAAIAQYRQIIATQTRFYGPQHPYTRHSQFHMARLQSDSQAYLEALSFSLSEEDTLQRRVRQELLLAYLDQKQMHLADSLLKRETGQAWLSTSEGYRLQAQLAWQQGRLPQANQLYEQACQQLRLTSPPLFAQLRAGWEWGQLHFEQKNYARAAHIWENMLDPDAPPPARRKGRPSLAHRSF
ncbi:MAG: tetratricopeptide repeat protein [Microscillaceae bacterium]|nr:tetratricopeptide repeat protein [Microscillaceae bacterium]